MFIIDVFVCPTIHYATSKIQTISKSHGRNYLSDKALALKLNSSLVVFTLLNERPYS